MEIIFELFFSIIGELLLQLLAELLIELGFHGLAETIVERKDRNPYYAFFGYCILGVIVGLISLLIFPVLLLAGNALGTINLIVTPTIAGFLMSFIGWLRRKHGQELIRLDSFMYGFAFAFCMALTRYSFGE